MIRLVSLLGLEFADLSAAEAAEAIASRPADRPFGYVVTPNADYLVRLSDDPDLAGIYRGACLCLLDSRVVAGMARGFGLRAPRVASGSDVTELLLQRHIHTREKIVIIGLRPKWLPALVERCGLAEPYHYDPPMGFDRDPAAFAATVAFVVAHPARLVFLAVGSPRQERLAAAVAATGRATGTGLCVGASLGFLVGAERRAPAWIRRCGLEWAYRLMRDPRRMARRYLVDSPRVVALLARAAVARRFGGGGVPHARQHEGANDGPVRPDHDGG